MNTLASISEYSHLSLCRGSRLSQFLLHHCSPAAMAMPVGTEITQFKFALAVPSSYHFADEQLHSAELTCIDELVPQPGALVAEYPEKYCCRFCDHTVVVLVSEMQNAKSYRMFCTVCFSGISQNDCNEFDLGGCCDKSHGRFCVFSVHEALLMHHAGSA